MIYRSANFADATDIARLHAISWQSSYRGLFSDEFLANDALKDRQTIWDQRLGSPTPGQTVIVAEEPGALVGFVCMFLGHDDRYGALLDNLHIAPDQQRRGIGQELMRLAMACLREEDPESKMYLWVFSDNVGAIRFYEKLGGAIADKMLYTGIGDKPVPAVRMIWNAPGAEE